MSASGDKQERKHICGKTQIQHTADKASAAGAGWQATVKQAFCTSSKAISQVRTENPA